MGFGTRLEADEDEDDRLCLLLSPSFSQVNTVFGGDRQHGAHLSREKKTSYFPLNPGCLIRILIMVYFQSPHNWIVFHPPAFFPGKQPRPGALFCSRPSLSNSMLAIQFFSSPMEPTPNLGAVFTRPLAARFYICSWG